MENEKNQDENSIHMDQESVDFVFEVNQKINTNNQKPNNLESVSEKNSDLKSSLESQHKKLLEEEYLNRSMQSFEYSYYPSQMKQIKKHDKKNNFVKDLERSATIDCFSGRSKSNGYITNKINPILDKDLAYINRNKLVNRRLVIRKQLENSVGLQSYTNPYVNEFPTINRKISTEFKLANPIDFFYPDENESESGSEENYVHLEPNVSQNQLDQTSNIFMASLINENMPIENKDMKKRSWYNAEAKKFFRFPKSSKTSSVVIIEKKSYKFDKDDGPNPFSYHIPRRPPNEKNAPVFSIGKRIFKEKPGGGRTSWEKEWYNSNNPFTIKTNFNREHIWPAPNNYKLKSLMGSDSNNPLYPNAPLHTIGIKLSNPSQNQIEKKQDSEPTVSIELTHTDKIEKDKIVDSKQKKKKSQLNIMESFNHVGYKAPQVSIQFRNKGTILWPDVEKTPGPGSYDLNKFKNVIRSAPKYSTSHARLNLNSNYTIGPFAAV